MAGILITDGLGGIGKEMIAVYSLPASNREVVIQEQIARTAVLFSSRWHNEQNYLITPISARALNDALTPPSGGGTSAGTDTANSSDSFHQEGNEFSGNWFRSRAVSGQYLQAVRPSRFTLTVMNPSALDHTNPNNPPIVLSSFPQDLTTVYLRDLKGSYWTCDNLEPGRKKSCTSCEESNFTQFWNDACANAGGKLRPLLSGAGGRNGCFYATGAASPGDGLTTLGEIRWQVASAVYLGPWVGSAAPEDGP
jgi:hypothetical protein